MPHPASLPINRLLAECEIRRGRGSGPGGQHRNKVETAVSIEHRPTGVTGDATERRSQEQNRRQAVFRLRLNLALSVRCRLDEPPPPSQLWQTRLRGGRIEVSDSHDDLPALLAEALDLMHYFDFDLRRAAEHVGCSSSQLVKLLKKQPVALAMVNRERAERGLGKFS